jgi:uncharacterized protein (TIGR00288 family)
MTKNLALFIDFENIARGVRQRHLEERVDLRAIVEALSDKGRLLIKRAYGDWSYFRDYRSDLLQQGIEPVQVFAASRDREGWKNGADIRMAIDAIETSYRLEDITDFVLVSGDSDFLALVSRLRERGRTVWGIGLQASSSQFLVKACDHFLFYEDIADWSPEDRDELGSHAGRDSGGLLIATVRRMADRQGLPGMPPPGTPLKAAAVKAAMRRVDPSWDERFEGFTSFAEFVQGHSDQILCGKPGDAADYYLAERGSMAETNLQRMLDFSTEGHVPHEALPREDVVEAIRKALRESSPGGDAETPQRIGVRGAQLKAQLRADRAGFDESAYGFTSFLDFLLSMREHFRVARAEPRGDVFVAEKGSPAEQGLTALPEATAGSSFNGSWTQSDAQRYIGALRIGRIRYVPAQDRYKIIRKLFDVFQESWERGEAPSLKEAKDELHEWFEANDPAISWDSVNNVVYHMFWTYCFEFGPADDETPLWDRTTSWAGGDTTADEVIRRCDTGLVRKIAEVVGQVEPAIVVDVLGDGDQEQLEYFTEVCEQVNQRFTTTAMGARW